MGRFVFHECNEFSNVRFWAITKLQRWIRTSAIRIDKFGNIIKSNFINQRLYKRQGSFKVWLSFSSSSTLDRTSGHYSNRLKKTEYHQSNILDINLKEFRAPIQTNFNDSAKMKPLVTSKQVLTWLYLCPDASSTQSLKLALGVSVFTVNLANIIVSGAYGMKFATTDLGEVLYALFEALGFFSLCYNLVIAFLSRNKTSATLRKLSDIYKQCENQLFSNESDFKLKTYCCYVDYFPVYSHCIKSKNQHTIRDNFLNFHVQNTFLMFFRRWIVVRAAGTGKQYQWMDLAHLLQIRAGRFFRLYSVFCVDINFLLLLNQWTFWCTLRLSSE